jgi:hypothetical protein
MSETMNHEDMEKLVTKISELAEVGVTGSEMTMRQTEISLYSVIASLLARLTYEISEQNVLIRELTLCLPNPAVTRPNRKKRDEE